MNRQPYCRPPRAWGPRMSPLWVQLTRGYRWRVLQRKQRIVEIKTHNMQVMRDAVQAGHGVLVTPNHSAHYDSAALYIAADRIDQPLYFLTAWQVFALSSRFEQWAMQRLGCFSIDRESTDRAAFKCAVDILQNKRHPLVIFPEGDIYHTTDIVTPFREGAAAIALSAAKRSQRPLVVIPCAIRFQHVDDPTPALRTAVASMEQRLYLRSHSEQPLVDRVHTLAEAALRAQGTGLPGCHALRTRAGTSRVLDRGRIAANGTAARAKGWRENTPGTHQSLAAIPDQPVGIRSRHGLAR